MGSRCWVIVAGALWVSGCAADDAPAMSPPPDPPSPMPEPAPEVDVHAPTEAAVPQFAPCPSGWEENRDGTCGVDTGQRCPVGSGRWPSAAACEEVGSPCGAMFPSGLIGPTVYVADGALAGDGSEAAPFGTIAEGLAQAPVGGTVALAQGTYREALVLEGDVRVVGACAAGTVIEAPDATDEAGTVQVRGTSVELADLTVTGRRPGIVVGGGSGRTSLRITGVIVRGATVAGIVAFPFARVTAEALVVSGVRHADYGCGIVADGGSVSISRGVIEDNQYAGVLASAGGEIALDDALIRDTVQDAFGFGLGLLAMDGGRVVASRSVVERSVLEGALATGPGSELELRDAVIRDTRADPRSGIGGYGVYVEDGAALSAERLLLDGNRDSSLFSMGEGTTLSLTDVLVRRSQPQLATDRYGRGIEIEEGTQAELLRVLSQDNREHGLFVAGAGTQLRGQDVRVEGTEVQRADGFFGRGVTLRDGAEVAIERLVVTAGRDIGVLVRRARAQLSDTIVEGMLGDELGEYGRGIEVEACTQVGAETSDCAPTDLRLARAVLRQNREVALAAYHEGATLEAVDVRIAETTTGACVSEECLAEIERDRPFEAWNGSGAGSYEGAQLSLSRFRIADNPLCGVQVAGGTMDLAEGSVVGNAVGANVQTEGYDAVRLSKGVTYRNNGVNFDGTTLPVPAPSRAP